MCGRLWYDSFLVFLVIDWLIMDLKAWYLRIGDNLIVIAWTNKFRTLFFTVDSGYEAILCVS